MSAPGLSGICTSLFSCDIYTDNDISESGEIILSLAGFALPKYYLSSAKRNGKKVSITAYDRCQQLNRSFDTKTLASDTDYTGGFIVDAAAGQCGFTSIAYSSAVTNIRLEDVTGKTCRQVIEEIAKADCVIVLCNSDNTLTYAPAESITGGIALSDDNISPINVNGVKSITHLICSDEKNSKTYELGNGDYSHAIEISGTYMTESISNALASRLLNSGSGAFKYTAWECSKAKIDSNIDVGGGLTLIDHDNKTMRVLSVDMRFCALGVYAVVSAPDAELSAAEYADKKQRELNSKIAQDALYGCVRINLNKGFTLVNSGEEINSG